jgi:GT2 family glycosyltransferase
MTRLHDLPKTFSVVIPTFQRPDWVKRAVLSFARQTRLPDEIIVVMRDTDEPTHRSVDELLAAGLPFVLRPTMVSEPGFLPPVKKGVALANSDVVAVMDDDAEALENWVELMLDLYREPSVGAVGGRYINVYADGTPVDVPDTDKVGYVSTFGRFIGDMYKRPTFTEPVDVEFMMGGCMSYRREVAQTLEFDMELNHNVGFGYEADLGLQVKAMGWRILFHPQIAIRHYGGPRQLAGMRSFHDAESIRWSSYNHARVVMRRLPPFKRAVALGYLLAIGYRVAPGLLPLGVAPLARRMGFHVDMGGAALRGRTSAVQRHLRDLLSRV